jgi:hypothetical protein
VWWTWEIEQSPHLYKRMGDRRFNELDLRGMLDRATGLRENIHRGRWVVETRFRRRVWEIVVEPDSRRKVLVVVTAYAVWE